ncbi:HNH endonuclease signature motif containing protein [Novosphingobium sp.]|uniref:HNH endonuclease signature motif containing protein n=1 Tax=Novosphingobium sp. TaxID=1874826 RepID=UPI0038BC3821
MVTLAGRKPRLASRAARFGSPPKRALPFYRTAEWAALVKAITAQRGKRCERCGADGRIYADHVVELKDGGDPLDQRNIELLCASCHGRKTALRRRERAGLV